MSELDQYILSAALSANSAASSAAIIANTVIVTNQYRDAAADSAALAVAWAEGTLPGGAGTKSAKEWAGDAALSAATAEAAAGPTYASTAAGLAATINGQTFAVDAGGGLVSVYLNSGGTAVLQRTLATTAYLASSAGAGAVGLSQGGTVEQNIRWISIEQVGAVASADQSTATANVTAIRAALLLGVATGRPVMIPKRSNPFLVNDNFELDATYSGLQIIGEGTIKFADTLVAGNVQAPWMFVIKDRVNEISNLKIKGITLDGNRANVKQSGVTPAASFGIWTDPTTLLGENVVLDNLTTVNFVTSGIQILQGPIVVNFPTSSGHGQHGIGVDNDPGGMLFRGWVSIVSPRTSNCEGYGIDWSGGKSICVDHIDDGSWYGNAKASIGLEHLIIRGAKWLNSPGNPAQATSGRGFLTTGTGSDFANSVIDVDDIYIENPKAIGFTVSGFDGELRIGSIVVNGGDPTIVNNNSGAISIAARRFSAVHLEANNSASNGILVTGDCKAYSIGNVVGRNNAKAGFVCLATTSAVNGVISRGLLLNNNQSGLTGSTAAALQHSAAGTCKVNGVVIEDTQGTATQVSGMYFAGAVKADVDNCHFGAGIVDGQQVYSATAGTRVRFGRNNTGIVTFARGRHTADGGGINLTVTFPTAMTSLGGAVFYGQMTPGSADAAGAHYINPIGTALTVIYSVATPAGTNNISYHYDVEMEIQR